MKTYVKAVFVASLTLIVSCSILLARQPATRRAAASRPAEAYPGKDLCARCDRQADALRKKLDKSFTIAVEPPFVVAGNMPMLQLQRYVIGTVTKPAQAMWKSYFRKKPDQVITVLLFTDSGEDPPAGDSQAGYVYRKWAKTLFGDKEDSPYGYYKPDKRTMVMNIDTGGGTLVHELTHALIVYDFPDVPDWFNEGLGSLHEQCDVREDRVIGLENWRLPALQKAIADKKLRPLRDLLTKDDFRGQLTGMNYAQARYLCMYMQEKGLLKDFYAYYRDHHAARDSGVRAVEHIFKKPLDKIEKDYLAWVQTLNFPPRR